MRYNPVELPFLIVKLHVLIFTFVIIMPRRSTKYSKKEKLDILKKLKANDFNKMKTSKQTGVSPATIGKWLTMFEDKLALIEPEEARVDSLVPLTQEMDKRYEEYIIEALDVRIKILKQIKDNIHKIRSPLMGATILKTIDESIINNFKAIDPDHKEGKPGKTLNVIYKQIYNKATT